MTHKTFKKYQKLISTLIIISFTLSLIPAPAFASGLIFPMANATLNGKLTVQGANVILTDLVMGEEIQKAGTINQNSELILKDATVTAGRTVGGTANNATVTGEGTMTLAGTTTAEAGQT